EEEVRGECGLDNGEDGGGAKGADRKEKKEKRRLGAGEPLSYGGCGQECADGKEVPVREVNDPHHAVDEGESSGDEKKDRRVEERVEEVDDEYVHRGRLLGYALTTGQV